MLPHLSHFVQHVQLSYYVLNKEYSGMTIVGTYMVSLWVGRTPAFWTLALPSTYFYNTIKNNHWR